MQNRWRRIASLLVCLTLLANIAGWLPTAEAALISTKEEIELGRRVANDLERQYGLVGDVALQDRVARIGARIAAASERQDIQYSFKVLNSKEVNALALPGGYVYLFKGLVDYMPSDDELAGIIGHEVGHISKRHTVRQIEKSLGVSILFGVVFGDRGVFLQNLVANAIMAGYSRADEREADQLGYYHTTKAGYNPYSMLMGLQKLNDLERKGNYGLFSTHPEPEARVSLVQGYMNDSGIKPKVATPVNSSAQIADRELNLPPLTATYRGYRPFYRACFAAGALHLAAKTPDFSGDRFILDSDGTYMTIYYDDREIITLTPQDATSAGLSLDGLSQRYIDAFKIWAATAKP